jgi:chemotaxis protein CheX
MTAAEDDICEIAVSIWETMFTTPLHRTAPTGAISGSMMTGCVTIEGAWEGAVMLSCEQALARDLAGELFGQGATMTEDDVRDTIGEVTNMLAGNFKAELPPPSRLSLPTVAVGIHYGLSVVGTTQIASVRFRCGEGLLQVSVHESTEQGAA